MSDHDISFTYEGGLTRIVLPIRAKANLQILYFLLLLTKVESQEELESIAQAMNIEGNHDLYNRIRNKMLDLRELINS
jgi:hypothetical protein